MGTGGLQRNSNRLGLSQISCRLRRCDFSASMTSPLCPNNATLSGGQREGIESGSKGGKVKEAWFEYSLDLGV